MDERLANAQMHKANMEWMRAESNKSHKMLQMLMNKIGIKPISQLSPTAQSLPMRLEGQSSSLNMSKASTPLQSANVPSLVPTKELPLPPQKSGPIAMDEIDAGIEMMDTGSEPIKVGHNLVVDASEAELGNISQPTDDPTSGCAL